MNTDVLQIRFPFRAGPNDDPREVRQRIATAITGVERMIFQIIEKRLPAELQSDLHDIAQEVRIRLATHCLPRFDTQAGTKVSTFLHTCITRAAIDEICKLGRRRRADRIETTAPSSAIAPDTSQDRHIEALAHSILTNPTKHFIGFNPRQLAVLLNDRSELSVLAKQLGVSRGHASKMLSRLRKQIKEIVASELAA